MKMHIFNPFSGTVKQSRLIASFDNCNDSQTPLLSQARIASTQSAFEHNSEAVLNATFITTSHDRLPSCFLKFGGLQRE